MASGAGVLLTADSGFTRLSHETVEQLPYEVHTPDTFFVLVDDSAPEKVRTVTRKQLEYWLEKTGEADLPARLRAACCPGSPSVCVGTFKRSAERPANCAFVFNVHVLCQLSTIAR